MLTKLADYVRYYADLEDENVLSDIEDLRREVADIPIADNPEERISSLEDEVAELKQCIQGLKAGN